MAMIKTVCAWCGDGQAQVKPGEQTTHGICQSCGDALETVGNLPPAERASVVAASLNFPHKITLWDDVPKRTG